MRLAIFASALALAVTGIPAKADVVSDWAELQTMADRADDNPTAPYDSASMAAFCRLALAMFEAANAADPKYASYLGIKPARAGTSVDAAVASAAHAVLSSLYPEKAKDFDDALTLALDRVSEGRTREDGIALGKVTAKQALERGGWDARPSCRTTDRRVPRGAGHPATYRFRQKCPPGSPGF
jgi:hypothetical protein